MRVGRTSDYKCCGCFQVSGLRPGGRSPSSPCFLPPTPLEQKHKERGRHALLGPLATLA